MRLTRTLSRSHHLLKISLINISQLIIELINILPLTKINRISTKRDKNKKQIIGRHAIMIDKKINKLQVDSQIPFILNSSEMMEIPELVLKAKEEIVLLVKLMENQE